MPFGRRGCPSRLSSACVNGSVHRRSSRECNLRPEWDREAVAALRLALTTGSAGRVGTQAEMAGANFQGRSPPLGGLSRQVRRGGTPCRSLRYGGLLRRSAATFSSSCVAWAASVIALSIYSATPAVASTVWARLSLAEFCSCLAEAARSRTAGRPALPAMAGTESVPAA